MWRERWDQGVGRAGARLNVPLIMFEENLLKKDGTLNIWNWNYGYS